MKIKKILITFSILVFFSLIVESICPKIVIYGAPNIKAKVKVVMDFYDKYYDGDLSIWYVDKLKNSTKEKQLKPKKYILFNYPIIYDKKGSKNFIIMYYMYENENTSFHRIFINADLLYFQGRKIMYEREKILSKKIADILKSFNKDRPNWN